MYPSSDIQIVSHLFGLTLEDPSVSTIFLEKKLTSTPPWYTLLCIKLLISIPIVLFHEFRMIFPLLHILLLMVISHILDYIYICIHLLIYTLLYITYVVYPINSHHMAMDQYLYIPFLVGYSHPFTSYFDVHQGYQGFDTLPYVSY